MDKKDNNNQFFDVGIKKKERYMWMIICFSMILFIVVVMIKPAVFYNIREVIKTVYYQIIPDAYEERGGKYTIEMQSFDEYTILVEPEIKWWESGVIAHACGGIDGIDYTNSLEAFKLHYNNGCRVFEIDLDYTKDNKLVAIHKWETDYEYYEEIGIPLYEQYMGHRIMDKYTPLDLEMIMELLTIYPDVYIVLDTKSAEENLLNVYNDYINKAYEYENYEDLLNHTIIQLYYVGQYDELKELYAFENVLFTAYKMTGYPNEILKECLEKNISVVTVPAEFYDDQVLNAFQEKGIILLSHTVNDVFCAKDQFESGIKGIYTDFLSVSNIKLLNLN